MNRQEFKQKYLVNAFFWVDKSNHQILQAILIDFGFMCHTGFGAISWHDGFKNLVTFKADKYHDFDYFQKTDMWHPNASYGAPKDYDAMMKDYELISEY